MRFQGALRRALPARELPTRHAPRTVRLLTHVSLRSPAHAPSPSETGACFTADHPRIASRDRNPRSRANRTHAACEGCPLCARPSGRPPCAPRRAQPARGRPHPKAFVAAARSSMSAFDATAQPVGFPHATSRRGRLRRVSIGEQALGVDGGVRQRLRPRVSLRPRLRPAGVVPPPPPPP